MNAPELAHVSRCHLAHAAANFPALFDGRSSTVLGFEGFGFEGSKFERGKGFQGTIFRFAAMDEVG